MFADTCVKCVVRSKRFAYFFVIQNEWPNLSLRKLLIVFAHIPTTPNVILAISIASEMSSISLCLHLKFWFFPFPPRFVQWRSFLVRRSKRWRGHRDEREQLELVDFQSGNLFNRYYFQDESDQGVMMETTVPTKEVGNTINAENIGMFYLPISEA